MGYCRLHRYSVPRSKARKKCKAIGCRHFYDYGVVRRKEEKRLRGRINKMWNERKK